MQHRKVRFLNRTNNLSDIQTMKLLVCQWFCVEFMIKTSRLGQLRNLLGCLGWLGWRSRPGATQNKNIEKNCGKTRGHSPAPWESSQQMNSLSRMYTKQHGNCVHDFWAQLPEPPRVLFFSTPGPLSASTVLGICSVLSSTGSL